MKALFDFFPLVAFFAAYKFGDQYLATKALLIATALQFLFLVVTKRKIETMHWVTFAAVGITGTLTLVFHNDAFIQWKPTIIYWIFAAILLVSQIMGKPAIKVVLGSAFELTDQLWRNVNLSWAAFFVALSLLNIYIAFYFQPLLPQEERFDAWVNFKVFWSMGLTMAFSIGQILFLMKYMKSEEPKTDETPVDKP